MKRPCGIILAAGEGKRMYSNQPKVLAEILFTPMLSYVIAACEEFGMNHLCAVTGYQGTVVEEFLQKTYRENPVTTVRQAKQLGTGHAVLMAKEFLKTCGEDDVCVLCGDAPCVTSEVLDQAYQEHLRGKNAVTVVSAKVEQPLGYGRVLYKDNRFIQIVEQKDATLEQQKICEVNSGIYFFRVEKLLMVLEKLDTNNAQGEYYLTQAVELLYKMGESIGCFCTTDCDVVLGVNDRLQQLDVSERLRQKIIHRHALKGVCFVSTDGVLIAPSVTIGSDTTILPNVILGPNTTVGSSCVVGPNTVITGSQIGDRVKLNAVQCYQSVVHDDVEIGPFVHIRPHSEIKSFVHIGDFVEVKNSIIGEGTGIAHLTYVGDSDVGQNVNFGCGVVTVNYDGGKKARCQIDDDAFLGCNTNLIAPVHIGKGAYTAAGSTIVKDVPAEALAIARSPQQNKLQYGKRLLSGKKKKFPSCH